MKQTGNYNEGYIDGVESKQEAEKTIDRILNTSIHFPYKDTEDGFCVGTGYMVYKSAVTLAIQDRQSVLERLEFCLDFCATKQALDIYNAEIQSITNQIEYLKTKI